MIRKVDQNEFQWEKNPSFRGGDKERIRYSIQEDFYNDLNTGIFPNWTWQYFEGIEQGNNYFHVSHRLKSNFLKIGYSDQIIMGTMSK